MHYILPLAAVCPYVWLPLLQIAMLGVAGGVGSMLLYWRLSPQGRLAELGARAAEGRTELRQFDGTDVRVVWALARRTLGASLLHLGLTLLPTLLAMVPVILLAWPVHDWLAVRYPAQAGSGWGIEPHSLVFWMPLGLSALFVKLRYRIK